MNSPARSPAPEEDDQGEVFLDDSDIIHEVTVDDEGISLHLRFQLHVCFIDVQ